MHTFPHTTPHQPTFIPVILHPGNWIESHPRAVKHALRVAGVSIAAFTLLNIGLFVAQNGRTSAFASVNGKSYGLMPLEDAKQIIETEFAGAQLTLNIQGKTVIINAKDSGVSLDSDKTFSALTEKHGMERLPIVSAVGNLFVSVKPVFKIDEQYLAAQLTQNITNETVAPTDASVTIPADSAQAVIIKPGVNGHELNAVIAAEQAAAMIAVNDFTVKIIPKTVLPKWSEQDMLAFIPAIEAARSTSMAIEAGTQKLEVSAAVLVPMLRVNGEGISLKMTLDTALLQAYLDQQAKVFFTAPIATKTVQKDGTVINRTEGTPGKKLNASATAALAITAFEANVLSVVPELVRVDPEEVIVRTYSNTDEGLFKLIEHFAKSHSGKYRIAAVELSGTGHRSAFYEADTSIATASTYKPFIAYGIMQRIEDGSLTMDNATGLGSIEYCMRRMLIISDNNCARELQSVVGWASFDEKLKADGFPATQLNNYSGGLKYSTARDEANLLARLYNHELVSAGSSDYIFGLMKQQIYNTGIKAGSRGSVVAAKAGYLDSLVHDIGIVYSPKSTYALVILTSGAGGYANVRALAGQVYDFYNQ